MSSRGSSRSSSISKDSSKKGSVSSVSTDDFRFNILEPHNIFLADGYMGQEQWSNLAFSLGISARPGHRVNIHTQKLCQKMKKRKTYSASQTYELVKPFMEALISTCPRLSQKNRSIYHNDAIPQCEALRNTISRLPTPKPAISVGYHKEVFTTANAELQTGIIAGPMGEPHDLDRVSQPISGHYWPFFAVEFSDQSLEAAKQVNAVTAATLNNAVDLLTAAATEEARDWEKSNFKDNEKGARSFSLSFHDKTACLSTHIVQGGVAHVSMHISEYRLDSEDELASLADRIYNIMIWGQHARLEEVSATLDKLDKKVHGDLSDSDSGYYEFDPHCIKNSKLHFARRPDIVRVAFRAGLPGWLKA